MKPACYGSLSCPENYECSLTCACGESLIEELTSVPLSVFHVVYERRMMEFARAYCNARIKTFGWESKVKKWREKR